MNGRSSSTPTAPGSTAPSPLSGRTLQRALSGEQPGGGAFTEGRIDILKLLSGQISVSIADAELYERLGEKVRLRTTLAEGLKPEEVVALMNTYLSVMTEVLGAHRATTIDFVGDAIIAVSGAPKSLGDDAARGVACAIDMQRAMGKVNALNAAAGGGYDLRLPEAGGPWVALAAPVTVAYALVEHKQVHGEMVEAQLVALSAREAELIGPAPDALADVRLRIDFTGEAVFKRIGDGSGRCSPARAASPARCIGWATATCI